MNRFGLIVAAVLLALSGLAQAQNNTILSTYRIVPKPGKDAELKKALAAHAAKYHKGDTKWRAFQMVSGKDEGSFQLNEGLASWTSLEARKNISDEHDRDYTTTVLPLVDKTLPASYMRYMAEASTAQYAGTFKKVLVRHFYMKPGKGPQFASELPTWKKAFEKLGMSVTVWNSFFSGQPQYAVAYRLAGGWADLDHMEMNAIPKAFDEVAQGGYQKMLETLSQCVDRIEDDMMELVPEIGTSDMTSK